MEVLDPQRPGAIRRLMRQARALIGQFEKNFKQYSEKVTDEVLAVGLH